MLQTVLQVGHPIGQDPTGQHGAEHLTGRIDLVLLQPPQIEHRIVRNPPAPHLKKLLQLNPVVVSQLKTVNDHGRFPICGQLEQPHSPKCRLEPGGLYVKRHRGGAVQRWQVLDPKKKSHAWQGVYCVTLTHCQPPAPSTTPPVPSHPPGSPVCSAHTSGHTAGTTRHLPAADSASTAYASAFPPYRPHWRDNSGSSRPRSTCPYRIAGRHGC